MTPLFWIVYVGYYVALLSVVLGVTWTIVLYVAGNRFVREWKLRPPGNEADYLWVFMVPALNEAVTIADSVARLRAVQATNRIIIVINDGSDDDTGLVLERIAGPDLVVLTRVPPNARVGKAAALNNAYYYLRTEVLSSATYRHWPDRSVIIGIVDADGRLDALAPSQVCRHFDIPRVGGVQANVHIYNRVSFLTRMQELEFKVFGGLYQIGRSRWGAGFMGGNGQFNRLEALASVASEEGPWSDYLTEDQELGLRLLSKGWFGEQAFTTFVDQQGLNNLRRLYRQRARWMQGNLQVVANIRRLHAHHLAGIRRVDALISLLLPILTLVVGVAVVAALVLWIGLGIPFLPLDNLALTAMFMLLALGPVAIGVMVIGRGQGWRGVVKAIMAMGPYLAYTWLMWPVAFIGLYNALRGKRGWVKTAREAIETDEQEPTPDVQGLPQTLAVVPDEVVPDEVVLDEASELNPPLLAYPEPPLLAYPEPIPQEPEPFPVAAAAEDRMSKSNVGITRSGRKRSADAVSQTIRLKPSKGKPWRSAKKHYVGAARSSGGVKVDWRATGEWVKTFSVTRKGRSAYMVVTLRKRAPKAVQVKITGRVAASSGYKKARASAKVRIRK